MIVVDTSALMAIVLAEPRGPECAAAIAGEDEVLIAAPTLSEALIVAMRRNVEHEMRRLLDELGLIVIPLTADRANEAAEGYREWGKNFHPAKLNLGDSFAHALAMEMGCPLLFVGDDFSRTNVLPRLS